MTGSRVPYFATSYTGWLLAGQRLMLSCYVSEIALVMAASEGDGRRTGLRPSLTLLALSRSLILKSSAASSAPNFRLRDQ